MINPDLLPKNTSTKLFKPCWEMLKEYFIKVAFGVAFITSALEFTSANFVCLPVRESNLTLSNVIDLSISIRMFVQNECFQDLTVILQYFPILVIVFPVVLFLINVIFYNCNTIFYAFADMEEIVLKCNDPDLKLLEWKNKLQNIQFDVDSSSKDTESCKLANYYKLRDEVQNLRRRFENSSEKNYDTRNRNGWFVDVSTEENNEDTRDDDNNKEENRDNHKKKSVCCISIRCSLIVKCVIMILAEISFSSAYVTFLLYNRKFFTEESKCHLKDKLIHIGHYDYFLCRHFLAIQYSHINIVMIILGFFYVVLILVQIIALGFLYWKKLPKYIDNFLDDRPGDIDPLCGDFKLLLCFIFLTRKRHLDGFLKYLCKSFLHQLNLFEADLKYPSQKLQHMLEQSSALLLSDIKAMPSSLRSRDFDLRILKRLEITNNNLHLCDYLQNLKYSQLFNLTLINCGIKNLPDLSNKLHVLKILNISSNDLRTIDVIKLPKSVMEVNITKNISKLCIKGPCSPNLHYFYVDKGSLFQWSNFKKVYVSDEVIKVRVEKPENLHEINIEASEDQMYDVKVKSICVVIINHEIQKFWDIVGEQTELDSISLQFPRQDGRAKAKHASKKSKKGKRKKESCCLCMDSTQSETIEESTKATYAIDKEVSYVLVLKRLFELSNCNVLLYGRETKEDDTTLAKDLKAIRGRAVLLIFMGDDRNVIEVQLKKLCENANLEDRPKMAIQLLKDNLGDHRLPNNQCGTLFAPVKREDFLKEIQVYFNQDEEKDFATILKEINKREDIPGSNLHKDPSGDKEKKFYFLLGYPWKNFHWKPKSKKQQESRTHFNTSMPGSPTEIKTTVDVSAGTKDTNVKVSTPVLPTSKESHGSAASTDSCFDAVQDNSGEPVHSNNDPSEHIEPDSLATYGTINQSTAL